MYYRSDKITNLLILLYFNDYSKMFKGLSEFMVVKCFEYLINNR